MAMTSASEFGVFGAAARIVLNGDTGPMVDGVGEAVVAGLSSDDDAALSGPLGDRRDFCETAQGGVVASLQGIRGFCEQRGEDGPSHSRQGCEDLRVMLLFLPWLGRLGWHEAGGQAVDPAMGVFDLTARAIVVVRRRRSARPQCANSSRSPAAWRIDPEPVSRDPAETKQTVRKLDAGLRRIAEMPADVHDRIAAYLAWLRTAPLRKLFIDAEPGVFITGRIRSLARSFPNEHHVVVEGLHFVQEDSPDEVGRAIAGWLQRI